MTKTVTRKTLENTKFYLTYLDEKGDKITLSFRDEERCENHIIKHEISKSNIKYKGNEKPRLPYIVGSLGNRINNYVSGIHTTKRGVSNG